MEHLDLGGIKMPALGLGTWPMSDAECERAVRQALEIGYRHIDTAEMYRNETEIGRAVAAAGVARADIFLTTKIWLDHLNPRDVGPAADACLRRLKMDYVDLLLIHWPNDKVPLGGTLDAMTRLKDSGKARAIGVGNFSAELLRQAITQHGAPVACNQFEYHPLLDQRAVVAAARELGVAITAYCPLARGRLIDQPVLKRIGAGYGKSAAQVALRWLLQQPGVSAIPKSSKETNLRTNFAVFDFTLSPAEMVEIDGLRGRTRVVPLDWMK